MKNGKKKMFAYLMAGCIALVGCGAEETANLPEKADYATGTVECKEVYVRAKIAGYLTDIPVEEGMEVKEGDLLFTTDERDVQVKQEQAAASASAASKAVDAAKATIEKAEANVAYLETEVARYQQLFAEEIISQEAMDQLNTQLEVAKLDVKAANAQYEAATGQLQAAQGVLSEVNLNLSQTAQYAPCNGTVTLVSSSVGELIGSGTTVITLTDYSDRWIMTNVDETELGSLKIGQEVPLYSKAYPDTTFLGKIVNISKNPDFAIKKSTNELNDQDIVTYQVKIMIAEDEDVMLYPGMLISVDFGKEGEA